MKLKEALKKYETVIKYLIFGDLTTAVGWITYFSILLGAKALMGLPAADTSSGKYIVIYTVAQVIQWIAAVCFAFFTNKKWVFTKADRQISATRQFLVFASGRVVTFFVDYGVTFFGVIALSALFPALNCVILFGKELNINELCAKLVAAVIVVVSNYFVSKLLGFKNK